MFTLKQYNDELLKFEVVENTRELVVKVRWVNDSLRYKMPLGMEISDEGVSAWLRKRSIPKNRAYVNNFLSKCGLNLNRPMETIRICKGLSLNDSYWVVEEDFSGTFEKYNLYENNFSNVLALIAFTGYGSSIRTSLASSPEFTTNGMLPKCWRREQGKIYLYKGGTSGFSNTGNEPYSEFYASKIAEAMGVNAIPYRLSKWKGQLCSTCEIFTDIDHSYIPVGRLVKTGGLEAVREFYAGLGEEFTEALNEMLLFDAIICNTDRHFGNFGVIVDNHTNRILKPAPLFDHGNALWNFAGKDDCESEEAFEIYVSTLMPCVYDDFIEEAGKGLSEKGRAQLRHLLNYRIGKNPRYNLDSNRLALIEKQIRKRAAKLLGE